MQRVVDRRTAVPELPAVEVTVRWTPAIDPARRAALTRALAALRADVESRGKISASPLVGEECRGVEVNVQDEW